MAEVTLTNVRKVYSGDVEAVRDFSLEIADGEFVVLVGASGCGKSTTLRMIAGLEEITGGEIRIGGRVVNDVHPKDRDIAMVFQNYALYPHMSVYKNMAFALKLRKVPKGEIDQRVRSAAQILGIEELLDRRPRQLSGGQRQRVAVGRCIVREPAAFLFDEPLSNLDAKLRVTTRAELKSLHLRLKTTTVYVTHDQEEAMTLGDRVVVMADGIIQQADSPFEVYQNPTNRFVASFIGMPPMNFFEGPIERNGDGLWFVEGSSDPDGGVQRLRIADEHADRLGDHAGRTIVMGIRPHVFAESQYGEALEKALKMGSALRVHIDVVEPLGDQMDAHGRTSKNAGITARLPAHRHLRRGEVNTLAVDMTRVHYFEPGEYGVSLLAAQPVGV